MVRKPNGIKELIASIRRPPGTIENVETTGAKYSPFVKGNRYAAAEDMSVESHSRRMQGLYKAWGVKERIRRGEKFMLRKQKEKVKRRKRARLRTTVVKEAREIQNMARTYATAAMNRLAEIVSSPDAQDPAAIAAATAILDRAYGKAMQTNVNANVDGNDKAADATSKELDTRIAEALNRVEALTGRAPKEVEGKEQSANLRKLH